MKVMMEYDISPVTLSPSLYFANVSMAFLLYTERVTPIFTRILWPCFLLFGFSLMKTIFLANMLVS